MTPTDPHTLGALPPNLRGEEREKGEGGIEREVEKGEGGGKGKGGVKGAEGIIHSLLPQAHTAVADYTHAATLSVGVGRFSSQSVCLFVRSIIQKRMIPKCSNLV